MFGIEKQILLNIELKDRAQYHHTTSKVTFTVHKLHLPDFLISDNNIFNLKGTCRFTAKVQESIIEYPFWNEYSSSIA